MKKTSFLPMCHTSELDNQLRYCLAPRPGVRSVALFAAVETGSVHEGPDMGSGLSHFLEHMLFQGCKNYPGQSIADTVNKLGGDVNAYTSFGTTCYYMELPSEALAQGISMLSSMVIAPEFPSKKFKHERSVILRERDLGKDSPDRALFESLMRLVFQHHNARHPIIGYADKIAMVSREQMMDYYRRRYAPGRTVFVAVGNFDPVKCEKLIAKNFAKWDRGCLNDELILPEPEQAAMRRIETTFTDPLGRLAFAIPVPGGITRDMGALEILSGILGASDASILVRELKHKRSLALEAGSFLYTPGFGGLLGGSISFAPEHAPAVEEILHHELDQLQAGIFDHAAVEREKLQQYAEMLRRLRTNSAIGREILANLTLAGAADYTERRMEEFAAITSDDIAEVASRYFAPERRSIVCQLPVATGRKEHESLKEVAPTLNSGKTGELRYLTWIDNKLPMKHFQLVLPGGTYFESAETAGASYLISELLLCGTNCHGEGELAELLDASGAVLEVASGMNSLTLSLDAPSEHFDAAFALSLEVLSKSTFASAQFEREQSNLLQSLASRAQTPSARARDAVRRRMYGDHPYALPPQGTEESIRNLTRDAVHDFYLQLLQQPRAVAGFGGDFTENEIKKHLNDLRKTLPWSKVKLTAPSQVSFPSQSTLEQVELVREQTFVLYALPGCANVGSDRMVLEIAQDALNGLSAKLFKSIREDLGLAYSTGASFSFGIDRGLCIFYAATEAKAAKTVLNLLEQEIARLGSTGLEPDEFEAARAGLKFNLSRRFEKIERLLLELTLEEYYDNDPHETLNADRDLAKITREQANAVLSRYFSNVTGAAVIAGKLS